MNHVTSSSEACYGRDAEHVAAIGPKAQAAALDPLRGNIADGHQAVDVPPPPRKAPFALVALALGGLVGFGGYHRWERSESAERTRQETLGFVPLVRTVEAAAETKPYEVELPGQTEPFDKAAIFARATGYVVERRVDIGSRVRKGDLLARIAAPELDEQLHQARAQIGQMKAQLLEASANVEQAQANVHLADVTDGRTTRLAGQGWATMQYADQTKATVLTSKAALAAADARVKVAQANLEAQMATVDRLQALTAFENVTAPFDGVVTRRTVDVGDLVHADSGTGSALFSMVNDAVLRVSVQVPQAAAIGIRDGLAARITIPQMPDHVFPGTVSRSSVALRYSSRTLLTEIDVSNPDNALRSGLYVSVTFDIPRERPSVRIPSDTLIFGAAGTQVAVVGPDGHARMRPVVIARDFGAQVELASGLNGHEPVIVSPPTDLVDGQAVTMAAAPPGFGLRGSGHQGSVVPARPAKAG